MSLQKLDTFCIFCYKNITCTEQITSDVERVNKFTKLLGRFVGYNASGVPDNPLAEQDVHGSLSTLLFKRCQNCEKITDQFCEHYHQLKLLELQLDLKLNKLKEILEHADKVPTRWIHLNKILEQTYPKDLLNKRLAQNAIRDLRQNVVKAAHHRLIKSQPRILLKKENPASSNETQMKSNLSSRTIIFDSETSEKLATKRNETRYTPEIVQEHRIITSTSHNYENYSNFMDRSTLENTDDYKVPCKLCKKLFPGQSALRQHIAMKLCVKIYKDGDGNFVCLDCGKRFRAISVLSNHLEFHKTPEEWKWECGECGKKFVNKFSLNVHLRSHSQERPFVCRFCGLKYKYNVNLKGHLLKIHGHEHLVDSKKKKERKNYRRIFESNLDSEKKLLLCKICKKSFSKFKDLRKHQKSKFCKRGETELQVKVECEDCRKTFSSDNALWMHQKEVHGNKVCLECGKQFAATYNYTLHLEYHKDPKEWKFECESCGRKCPSKYKLTEHLVSCGKKKKKKGTLKRKYEGENQLSLQNL